MKNTCPSLTEKEKKAELRKEVERIIAKNTGNQRGRSFQITAEEARGASDVVSGTFLVNSLIAKILFDSGANRSFMVFRFTHYILNLVPKLKSPLEVEVADSKIVLVSDVLGIVILK